MKKLYPILFLACTLIIGCSDDNSSDEQAISTDTAAEVVASSMAENSSGVSQNIMVSSNLAAEATTSAKATTSSVECGAARDSTVTRTGGSDLITLDYTLEFNYSLECDESGAPQTFNIGLSYDGTFDAPRLSSQNSGEGDWNITAFGDSEDRFLVNGSWSRSGSFQSKVRNKGTRNIDVGFDLMDIEVNKNSKTIEGGTIAFSLDGEASSDKGAGSFSYNGTITYNGDGSATIEIGNSTYITNVESGEIQE